MQSLQRGDFDTKPLCHLPGSGGAAGWPGQSDVGLYSAETDWAAGLMFAYDTM